MCYLTAFWPKKIVNGLKHTEMLHELSSDFKMEGFSLVLHAKQVPKLL